MEAKTVYHPQFGAGRLLKTYMSGFEWEVLFESGRRFRLPAREFSAASVAEVQGETTPSAMQKRTIQLETDQFRARQTLEALRVGIVPVQDAETLTIGLEAERVTLRNAFDRSKERGGDVLTVIADYGFGKSHFIELAARHGLRENFIIAGASLDLVEVPPGKAHKIYEALVTSLRYPDTNQRGLYPLIKKALEHPAVISQFIALSPREPKDCPLGSALLALQDCPSQTAFEEIVQWLSGQAKPQTEMKTCLKKPPRLYVSGETARQYSYLLTGISVLATMLGYNGLAVLIDESEHYSLLRAAQREKADSFFKAMIISALGLNNGRINGQNIPDHTRAEYPISYTSDTHLLFLFALTESADRMPVGTWLAPSQIVRLDDRFIEKDIREFFKTLLRYHALAYGYSYPPPRERYEEIALNAPTQLARALGQHRINLRELIRTAVTVCDLPYLYDDYPPDDLLAELKRGLKV
ncbi:MAG: BREX system ATP-binding domain-containing protein [Chloroflexota bacterium]